MSETYLLITEEDNPAGSDAWFWGPLFLVGEDPMGPVPTMAQIAKGEGQGDIGEYDPAQPRDPAGSSTGGQWTDTGGATPKAGMVAHGTKGVEHPYVTKLKQMFGTTTDHSVTGFITPNGEIVSLGYDAHPRIAASIIGLKSSEEFGAIHRFISETGVVRIRGGYSVEVAGRVTQAQRNVLEMMPAWNRPVTVDVSTKEGKHMAGFDVQSPAQMALTLSRVEDVIHGYNVPRGGWPSRFEISERKAVPSSHWGMAEGDHPTGGYFSDPGAPHFGRKGGPVGGSIARGNMPLPDTATFMAEAAAGAYVGRPVKLPGSDGAYLVSYPSGIRGIWKPYGAHKGGREGGHHGFSEVGAYVVSEMLGMHIVPPTVDSPLDGTEGTAQMWVPDSETGWETTGRMGSAEDYGALLDENHERVVDMMVLDQIVGNTDRHNQNYLFDRGNTLWAPDNGRARWEPLSRKKGSLSIWAERTMRGVGYGKKPIDMVRLPAATLDTLEGLDMETFIGGLTGAGVPRRNARQAWHNTRRLLRWNGRP